jgi:hypothetical protein
VPTRVASSLSAGVQLPIPALIQVREVHILFARIGKPETLLYQVFRGPGVRFMSIAFAAYVIKVGVVDSEIRELLYWAEVVNLEELFSTQERLRAFTVRTHKAEITTQKRTILFVSLKGGRRLRSEKPGHRKLNRTFEARQQFLDVCHQFATLAPPFLPKVRQLTQFILVPCVKSRLDSVEFK